MNTHTFLFKEGVWIISGLFFDNHNIPTSAEGEISIVHRENLWLNTVAINIAGETPAKINNRFSVVPFSENKDSTTWKSNRAKPARLLGRLTIVDDSLMSIFKSSDDNFYGLEYLMLANAGLYHNRGYAFRGSQKISSWSFELKRTL